jgi:hypothetical protein
MSTPNGSADRARSSAPRAHGDRDGDAGGGTDQDAEHACDSPAAEPDPVEHQKNQERAGRVRADVRRPLIGPAVHDPRAELVQYGRDAGAGHARDVVQVLVGAGQLAGHAGAEAFGHGQEQRPGDRGDPRGEQQRPPAQPGRELRAIDHGEHPDRDRGHGAHPDVRFPPGEQRRPEQEQVVALVQQVPALDGDDSDENNDACDYDEVGPQATRQGPNRGRPGVLGHAHLADNIAVIGEIRCSARCSSCSRKN